MVQYFHVPYSEKDKAYDLGARFDRDCKTWFADQQSVIDSMKLHFAPVTNPHPITDLEGEDRTFGGNHLYIHLVPMSCWFHKLRPNIDNSDWKRLNAGLLLRSEHKCEICGAQQDPKREEFLDVILRWDYCDSSKTQILKRLVSACPLCVKATNYGYSKLVGEEDIVRQHFRKVTSTDDVFLDQHIVETFGLWAQRSANHQKWSLDLSLLTNNGIRLARRERVAPAHVSDAQGDS
ncbi:hypothetical protein D7Y50_03890 [Stenotrophomonas maltophilia]|uniref:DUF5710 domain-containing protein n=1 Tax=Stenotrophomonas maltophilia TaxID=40324 RepID=UPI0015DED728|nr:DUF5710 domain-containing protein [Stenotrophomonas maltophilia]MBA0233289.1 hypothetical protein [Stenotrophomonas maltophilia]MBA0267328.1 hypothetical protein [Stenotrophomonas maltophilia]